MSRVVVVNSVTLDGVMQAPARPDEDRRGGFEHGAGGNFDCRLQHNSGEVPASVFRLNHRTLRIILVIDHHDSSLGAKIQVPKHMTSRKRRDQ